MALYEPAPAGASSWALRRNTPGYISSQFGSPRSDADHDSRLRLENLEALSFGDDSFDLVITQDVLEHVLNPDRAFAEIARVLRPGGAHVFTVPLYRRAHTVVRAVADGEGIRHLLPPDYHGDPVDPNGSLVVREWSPDLVDYIRAHSGLDTEIHNFRERRLGLAGEFLDVLISRKPVPP